LKLKEKTYKKFIDFCSETAKKNDNLPFEIAYSEIQRTTGVASVTMKKALQSLAEEGVIRAEPGRNSRYVKMTYLMGSPEEEKQVEKESVSIAPVSQVDILQQRVRSLELSLSVLQERLAFVEHAK
jgi:DNA-binding GntR family transcriptional regulator